MSTVHNFNAGPAVLPKAVLEHVQRELIDYQGLGLSIMEMSHRSKEYEAVNNEAEQRFKRLLGVGDDYRVLFLQGGASLQFAMLPLNFLTPGRVADYVLTDGSWSEKAQEEAARIGQTHIAGSSKDEQYRRIPRSDELRFSDDPVYVHLTSNNTIFGTQWHSFPDVGDRPLVADMSSDIMSRPFDAQRFSLIYAGAQKNLGPSGVTVVLIRQSFLETARNDIPTMLRYSIHAKNNSLYNTPPTFGVYVLNLVLEWIEDLGGVAAIGERNTYKAQLVYDAIDRHADFYRGHAERDSRSQMNITFRLPNEQLEKQFVSEAKAAGLIGLAGHRSVGGIRASIYNALPVESCETLAQFMDEFVRTNG